MASANERIVIIGGGITGLSAAWFLQARGVPYTLLERADRWGGKIRTEIIEHDDGPFVIEAGPDSFITQKPWAAQLARELGLADELIPTNDARRTIMVLHRGRLTPLPDGLTLIVPTKFLPFARSRLISPLGKLRMAAEPFIPPLRGYADESLADFVRRRLGAEALDRLAEPLMSGIYNTDPHDQSLLATFPRFRALEQQHGSLTRGMLAARRNKPTGAPPPMFLSFRRGMQTLVDRLVERLRGDLRLNTSVERIEQAAEGWRVALRDGSSVEAARVILATPAPITAGLIRPFAPAAADELACIRSVTTGTLSLAYRAADATLPPSFGVVIPRGEQRPINAVTISSTKFDHRAPADHVLLRVFFGGARTPHTVELDDTALIALVRRELERIYGIRAEPVLTRIHRWREASPQYAVNHLARVERIEHALPPGIIVAGSAFRGVGIPDCIHQAQGAVERALHE